MLLMVLLGALWLLQETDPLFELSPPPLWAQVDSVGCAWIVLSGGVGVLVHGVRWEQSKAGLASIVVNECLVAHRPGFPYNIEFRSENVLYTQAWGLRFAG